jgi:hypothetical protein
MVNNQSFYGSLCLTDLIEQAKVKHSAFSKGKNGKIYVNVNVWLNEEEDKYGNIMSVQLNPTKERKDTDAKVYIGNMKKSESQKPLADKDIASVEKTLQDVADDLPF